MIDSVYNKETLTDMSNPTAFRYGYIYTESENWEGVI